MFFLSFQRTKVSRSSLPAGRFSAFTNVMRDASSGTTTLTSEPFSPALRIVSFRISTNPLSFAKFFSDNEPVNIFGGSVSAVFDAMRFRDESTPATIKCLAVNSQAQRGTCGRKNRETESRRTLLNESRLIDFAQRRLAREHF